VLWSGLKIAIDLVRKALDIARKIEDMRAAETAIHGIDKGR
jgi:hypothetical protein